MKLPTENINREAIYLYNGDLYSYSDEWVFKDVITPLNNEVTVNFRISNYIWYKKISMEETQSGSNLYYSFYDSVVSVPVYDYATNKWIEDGYKTIFFAGFEHPTDEAFLAWLIPNTKQGGWRKYSLVTE